MSFLEQPAEAKRTEEIIASLRRSVDPSESDVTLQTLGPITQRDSYFFAMGALESGRRSEEMRRASENALDAMAALLQR